MNTYVAERYDERIWRLAAGIEPVDACRSSRVAPPIRIVEEAALNEAQWRAIGDDRGDPMTLMRPLDRHRTCRHVLLYRSGLYRSSQEDPRVRVRVVEGPWRSSGRRYVPRKLSIPLLDPATADGEGPGFRIWRPSLFPGAAYPIHDTATAIRGRAERGGAPVRWTRVEATNPDTGVVVGRAHGDDRGEFFLVLASDAASREARRNTLNVVVKVYGPDPAPTPGTDAVSQLAARIDPLWGLPWEVLPPGETTDAVSRGEVLPDHYTAEVSRSVGGLPLGRTVSLEDPFEVP